MTRTIRYSLEFFDKLELYYEQLTKLDVKLAERAQDAVIKAVRVLEDFPFIGRRVIDDDALMRELLVPFGASGYVILYDVESDQSIGILAIRHQRESDYH